MDVAAEVASWDGVTRDGIELRYGGRVLGRVHADGRVELRFHPRVRDMLVETGRAEPLGEPGCVGLRDAADAVELFRLAYERARVTQAVRAARA
jgi:hypothetical protein